MKNVVTLTMNPSFDKSTSIEHVVPERKLRCRAPNYEPGGGGINVSRAIHKLGGKSGLIREYSIEDAVRFGVAVGAAAAIPMLGEWSERKCVRPVSIG